jgi:RNA ligase (TIGR02306 family)
MATFAVIVKKVRAIEPIENADALEVAVIDGYRSVVKKGQYRAGDLIAYIPEQAVLPDPVLERLGMKGSSLLAGKDNNRVKAIKLRGTESQGICYPVEPTWVEGQDVTAVLDVEKYVPPIPAHLSGQVWALGREWTWDFDIENVKAWPDVLVPNEDVVFSEKVHGTWTGVALIPQEGAPPLLVVSSKGLFADGLAFKLVPENDHNVYVRVARSRKLWDRIQEVFGDEMLAGTPVYVLGETFGIQDLKYGANPNQDATLGFRVFDVYVGQPRRGRYLNDAELDTACQSMGLPRVPVLYRGPFSMEVMLQYTNGLETVSGKGLHIREGIVMSPVVERRVEGLGRVKLKSVSFAYLTRKGKKGEETTEFA